MDDNKKGIIHRAAARLNTLDASGYGLVVLRCDSERDCRMVVAKYRRAWRTSISKDGNLERVSRPANMLEVNALGQIRKFGEIEKYGFQVSDDTGTNTLVTKLKNLLSTKQPHLIYVPHAGRLLGTDDGPERSAEQNIIIELLLDLARRRLEGLKTQTMVVLSCTNGCLPIPLMREAYVLDIEYPDVEELQEMLRARCSEYGDGVVYNKNSSTLIELAESMRGFREGDVWRAVDMAFAETETPFNFSNGASESCLSRMTRRIKEQRINGIKGLSWIPVEKRHASCVGGLQGLRGWMEQKSCLFKYPAYARSQGADSLKGILLCGLPGSGKTTLARYAAIKLSGRENAPLPLLQLNLNAMLGKYVGESEGNFHMALQAVESVAPCVLLIDEVEKAFGKVSGSGSDGAHETIMHIFQSLLEWMQKEREKPIFAIATANKIEDLPPEFKRKGRFDEIFFVGVPTAAECADILHVHLSKKQNMGIMPGGVEIIERLASSMLEKAADLRRYLCGADIENLVSGTFARLFNDLVTNENCKADGSNGYMKAIYSEEKINQAMLQELEETRSFFDNNMKSTAQFWENMYSLSFRDAGGCKAPEEHSPGRHAIFLLGLPNSSSVVLPTDISGDALYDKNEHRFSYRVLKEHKLLAEPSAHDYKDSDASEYEQDKKYRKWVENQVKSTENLPCLDAASKYNIRFRWDIINELSKIYKKCRY